jgi:Family of unknown function (DUF6011)
MQVNSEITETHSHQFATMGDAKQFALAGNATITLESLKTGAHFTFKIREKESITDGGAIHFVSLLRGPNNESDFTYVGLIRDGKFFLTRSSRVSADAPSFKAFDYFWNKTNGAIPPQLVVHHSGRCGRCNRTLTTPESITRGIGPDCSELMGLDL